MEPTWWRLRGIGVAVLILCMGAGLLNGYWLSGGRDLPIYGWAMDAVLAAGVVTVIVWAVIYVRRNREVLADEFQVTKTRYATHTGFVIGLLIYSLTSLWPMLHPASYQVLLGRIGSEDAYSIGRVAGMLPFVLGMCIGQVAAWLKYR